MERRRDAGHVALIQEALSAQGAAMRLPASEVELFYKLHPALLLYVNQQLGLARHVTTIPQLLAMPEEERYALRSAFYEQRSLLDTFIQENPQGFSREPMVSWPSMTILPPYFLMSPS